MMCRSLSNRSEDLSLYGCLDGTTFGFASSFGTELVAAIAGFLAIVGTELVAAIAGFFATIANLWSRLAGLPVFVVLFFTFIIVCFREFMGPAFIASVIAASLALYRLSAGVTREAHVFRSENNVGKPS